MTYIIAAMSFMVGYWFGRLCRRDELCRKEQLARIRGQREGIAATLARESSRPVIH